MESIRSFSFAKRIVVLFVLSFLVAMPMVGFVSSSAKASSTQDIMPIFNEDVYKKLTGHQHYYYLASCFRNNDIGKMGASDVDGWDFFNNDDRYDAAIGAMYGGDGSMDCKNGDNVSRAAGAVGTTLKAREAFCKMENAKYGGENVDTDAAYRVCVSGSTPDAQWDDDGSDNLVKQYESFRDNMGFKDPGLDDAAQYMRAYSTLINGCNLKAEETVYDSWDKAVEGAKGESEIMPFVTMEKKGKNIVLQYRTGIGSRSDSSVILVATTGLYEPARGGAHGMVSAAKYPRTMRTCDQLAADTNTYAEAYKTYVNLNGYTEGGNPDGGGGDSEAKSTCVVDGVGWIVCAVANFMATITDGMYEHVIANMLSVPPLNVDTADGENGTYNAWSSIRNIANVLFVIAFLIVVYSQITGLGISNYAIKKMLPRIVLSAILVNLSYWIAAVGVDVSNILGAGIYAMLQGIRGGLNIGNVNGWAAVTTMLLSGGAIAGGVVLGGAITVVAVGAMTPAIAMALIGILLPLLLGALLAIFIVIFILVARQALVVILIIASPLAFVAFLLPNTQQWFTKWRQWFVSLLLLYPIVSFMVGGAQIAGLVLISTASNGFTDVIGDTIKIMSGSFVMVVPFFFLPFMIRRYGGAGLDRLAGSIKAKGGKLIAPVGKVGRKMGMQAMGRQWESLKAGNAPAMRRSRFGGRLGRGIDRLRTGAAQGATRGAQGYSQWQARNKMESEHYADQQQEALLDRLSTNEAFRTAAAGGDAAAADRLAARADAQVHKRRIDDATARLRTLSRDERIALAHGRTVTTAAGHTIVPDVAMQEAAIKSVAPSMNSREALDLADALGGGHGVDAAVRRAGVESLAGKAPQLTGSQLDALEGDTYSRDAATLAGLTGGNFDADWMATKAKADDIDELVAHIAGTTDPAERARLQAIVEDAVGKLDSTDTLRARVVAGSDLDQALDRLASSRSIPTSGPSGGTPPPSGSSGTGTPP